MNEAKRVALAGMLQNQIGLPSDVVGEILALVAGKVVSAAGGVVSPPSPDEVPGELAATGEKVLVQPGEAFLSRPQVERLQKYAATIGQIGAELRSGSGWRSRKLWVTVGTLGGLLAQLPMEAVLPPETQIIIGGIAAIYIIVQGILDALSKSRPLEPAA